MLNDFPVLSDECGGLSADVQRYVKINCGLLGVRCDI